MTRARPRLVPAIVLLGAILIGAAGQALTATPGFGRTPPAAFVTAVVVSAALLVGQLAATSWAVRMLITPRIPTRLLPLLGWATLSVLVGAVVTAVFVPAGLVVAIAAAFVLPVAGRARGLSGFAVAARHPWRSLLLAVGVIVFASVSVVVALVTGLFLSGTIGGFVAWLWVGAVIALLLAWGTRLQVRTSARK